MITHLLTGEKNYWINFKKDLSIPLGDAKARISLQKNLDDEIVREGFREGRNHEEDIDDMIWLFKNFKSFPFFKKAVIEWEKGDYLNNQLYKIGLEINSRLQKEKLDRKEKRGYLSRIMALTHESNINQDAFSESFGYGTRKIKKYLLFTNIFFILIIICSVSFYYSSMIKKLIFSKQKLNRRKKQLKLIIKDLENAKEDLSTGIIQHKKIIGTISHDIRSPLKYIQLISKHLSKETLKNNDTVSNKYANSIYKSSSQLYDFTKTLIQYSKIYMEDRDYIQKPYSIHSLFENKKDFFEEMALSKEIIIKNVSCKDLHSTINIRIMSIIIHNLLDNAIKNTSKGTIELGAQSDQFKTTYWIKDTGIGMNQDIIDYYTNLFKNRDPEKLILSTYGIGLHLVLELLIIIKGKIFFSSIPNKGTTITIELKHAK
ncbi:HAMP domain-containing sensor histidine kinase [Flavobacterium sp. NG2]|uniref:sensor histidine kinase n=1 Tax=Flavobacterium sp. NG2 TaxID=3097547 RepID=UPI002A823E8E|nr:HAMP domain-containing sensor histidine kinase [Flavobacterium sp. NG2]WPR72038.1 HAMP domain-containing sensor histidine kinase [Flavobacterium sp. NG2]